MELENLAEETNPKNPHINLILAFLRSLRLESRRTKNRSRSTHHRDLAQLGVERHATSALDRGDGRDTHLQ